jgi:WD40 repeat protein
MAQDDNAVASIDGDEDRSRRHNFLIQHGGILGGPITALLTVTDDNDGSGGLWLYYGHGPYLCRTLLGAARRPNNETTSSSSSSASSSSSSWRIMEAFASIHGILLDDDDGKNDDDDGTLIVYGGRELHRVNRHTGQTQCSIHDVKDWILAVRLDDRHLYVGLAHTTIQMRCKYTLVYQRNIYTTAGGADIGNNIGGPRFQTLYSLDLMRSGVGVTRAAAGTVDRTIVVWDNILGDDDDGTNTPRVVGSSSSTTATTTTTTTTAPMMMMRRWELAGHEGAVHAVTFNAESDRLASASDDRTVRLWDLTTTTTMTTSSSTNTTNPLVWTAYGHSARIWDVQFCPHHHHPQNNVASCGEDATVRLWNGATGASLHVWHFGGCVWRLAVVVLPTTTAPGPKNDHHDNDDDVLLVAAVNMGAMALLDLRYAIPRHTTIAVPPDDDQPPPQQTSSNSMLGPAPPPSSPPAKEEEIVAPSLVVMSKKKRKSLRKKRSLDQQVVFGMTFLDADTVLVATRAGSMWKLGRDGSVSSVAPWTSVDGSSIPPDASCACCMAVNHHHQNHEHQNAMPQVAIGTRRGTVHLSSGEWLDTTQYRAVQQLQWLDATKLLALYATPGTAAIWSVTAGDQHHHDQPNLRNDDNNNRSDHKDHHGTVRLLRAPVNGIGICHAANGRFIVMGDTRGNMALFDTEQESHDLPNNGGGDGIVQDAVSVLRKVHGKEHVTSLVWQKGSNTIYSVGNDGCLAVVKLDVATGEMTRLLSLPLKDFTGLSHVWAGPDGKIIVGGYYGNEFAIVGLDDGYYEYCRVDTGSRQCMLSLYAPIVTSGATEVELAVGVLRKVNKGGNVVDIWNYGGASRATLSGWSVRRTIGHWMHSETIFDADIFRVNSDCFVLVTGSEDCATKLSVVRDTRVLSVQSLPLHTSGVRAVATLTNRNGTTMVATGGKLELHFFLVEPTLTEQNRLTITAIGSAKPENGGDDGDEVDQRVNTISMIQVSHADLHDRTIIVCGSSSGACYRVEFENEHSGSMILFYQGDRPILSSCIVSVDGACYCIVGTSAGEAVLFRLDAINERGKMVDPLLLIKAHSVGLNSVAASITRPNNSINLVRIFTGGDDQAVALHTVAIETKTGCAELQTSCTLKNAGWSAIRGIRVVDDGYFLSTGYDQRLKLWSYDDEDVHLDKVLNVGIGDVNCLAVCPSQSSYVVAVCGSGVEIFNISELK